MKIIQIRNTGIGGAVMQFKKKRQENDCEIIEVKCPFCQSALKVPVRSYISAQKDLSFKIEAMLGKLFHPSCPVCGSQVPVSRFLAYEDRENRSVIYFEPDPANEKQLRKTLEKRKEEAGCVFRKVRYRICRTQQDFYEKIRILDCSLDDRIVEIMKLCIIHYFKSQRSLLIQNIRFHIRKDRPVFRIQLENADGYFSFSTEDYSALRDSLNCVEKEFSGFDRFSYLVNQDWAARALLRIQEKFFDLSCIPDCAENDPDEDLLIKSEEYLYSA